MTRLRYPFRYGALCVALGIFCTIAAFYILYGRNALRVNHNGVTEVIQWPHAYSYSDGDTIRIPMEDGTDYTAVVEDVITLPTELLTDQEGGLQP